MSGDRSNSQPCQSNSSVGSLRLSTYCCPIVRGLQDRLLQIRSHCNLLPYLMTGHPEARLKWRLALTLGPWLLTFCNR